MHLPVIAEVDKAIATLAARLDVVEDQTLPITKVAGRILAQALCADRDSPALDVSAMDGYALRRDDISALPLPVSATCVAGAGPMESVPGQAIRIFTGAPIPAGADCVIRREDTLELDGAVQLLCTREAIQPGHNIRRRGENIAVGACVLREGTALSSVAMAAAASFGSRELHVRRRLRLAVLNTGDELAMAGENVKPWMIRDSNGPMLDTWLNSLPWLKVVARARVADSLQSVRETVGQHLLKCDAVILTGGVSMGDTDYVPAAIESLGGEIAFHRLPIRPGRPVLGASLDGKLLLGLPGNPVSVAVTSRVLGLPLLSRLAGRAFPPCPPLVSLRNPDTQQLPLAWYRLVDVEPTGGVSLIESKGSGDLVSLARSSGFVAIPPGRSGPGPWPLTLW